MAPHPSHAPPPPPLLLTKRVTTFLAANLTSTLHTACLTTPSGNLLAHASTVSPARVLRRQAAVAASLWSIHASAKQYGRDVEHALPKTCSSTPGDEPPSTKAITVQLDGEDSGSVVVIRGLKCGVLFVAVAGGDGGERHGDARAGLEAGGGEVGRSPLASPGNETESILSQGGPASVASHTTAGSVGGMSTASVLAVRRQTEELARWLDDKLGGLSVPKDSVGGGWR
ncbi:hypothetical protein DL546_008817 [Coniochaeta pulveracea]|uniref:Roadblock/LAMTOR2 domain-containing protein n=1 Tax=Coniochaeta pulveracea TaxID=177199 RepID=A0A420YL62_9PEZI|nr:hypothetical protein DL546_008817 [Coniochaeta pulveracea]